MNELKTNKLLQGVIAVVILLGVLHYLNIVKLPFLPESGTETTPQVENFLGFGAESSEDTPSEDAQQIQQPVQNVVASSGVEFDEVNMPVKGIKTQTTSCYPQNTLKPDDLLPAEKSSDIKNFNEANPVGEGILKGVNFLDAGYHIGINTVGQSLRNANLNLRAEPPNPQVKVSPWMNSTIAPDLARKSLDDETVCNAPSSGGVLNGFDSENVAAPAM